MASRRWPTPSAPSYGRRSSAYCRINMSQLRTHPSQRATHRICIGHSSVEPYCYGKILRSVHDVRRHQTYSRPSAWLLIMKRFTGQGQRLRLSNVTSWFIVDSVSICYELLIIIQFRESASFPFVDKTCYPLERNNTFIPFNQLNLTSRNLKTWIGGRFRPIFKYKQFYRRVLFRWRDKSPWNVHINRARTISLNTAAL